MSNTYLNDLSLSPKQHLLISELSSKADKARESVTELMKGDDSRTEENIELQLCSAEIKIVSI